ncbi:MAG: DUF3667 domain-containing protein [Bacteroidota bacterium]
MAEVLPSPRPGVTDPTPPSAPTGDDAPVCLNCEAPRLGAYCQACGQHHLDDRLTVRLLLREFAQRFLKLERGLIYTTWRSAVAPGSLAQEYIGGKRKRYVNPLSYLLIGAAIAVLLIPIYASEERMEEQFAAQQVGAMSPEAQAERGLEIGMRARGQDPADLSPEEREQMIAESIERTSEFMPLYLETVSKLYSVFSFALVLGFALMLKLLFSGRKTTYTMAETLVLSAYVSAAYTILSALIASLLTPFALPMTGSFVTLVFFVLFSGYAAWGFYGRSWGNAALGSLSGIFALVFYLVSVVVVALPIVVFRLSGGS